MKSSAKPAAICRNEGLYARTAAFFRRHPGLFLVVGVAVLFVGAGFAYGTWEKTQYLAWLSAHPGQPQVPGPLTVQAKGNFFVNSGWWLLLWLSLYQGWDFRRRYRNWEERAVHPERPPYRPLGRAKAVLFVSAGIAGLFGVLQAGALAIEVFVWEGNLLYVEYLALVCGLLFSVGLMAQVAQEQGVAPWGVRPGVLPSPVVRPVSPEVSGRIREALAAGQHDRAAQIYGESTGADPAEARAAIMNLAVEIAGDGKSARQSLSWRRLFVLIVVTVVLVLAAFVAVSLCLRLETSLIMLALLYGVMVGTLLIFGWGCLWRKFWGTGVAILLGGALVIGVCHFHLGAEFSKVPLGAFTLWLSVGSVVCGVAWFAFIVWRGPMRLMPFRGNP